MYEKQKEDGNLNEFEALENDGVLNSVDSEPGQLGALDDRRLSHSAHPFNCSLGDRRRSEGRRNDLHHSDEVRRVQLHTTADEQIDSGNILTILI